MPRHQPIEIRFWSKVDTSAGLFACWPWMGYRNPSGYGRVQVARRSRQAPRVAWELTSGPIPDGLWVLHECDNPPCVNPTHLHLGTVVDNTREMDERGRRGTVPRLDTCKRGHPFTPENTIRCRANGRTRMDRKCRICRNRRDQISRPSRARLAA